MFLTKAHSMLSFDVMKIGQWVGRYDLKVDAGGLHIRDANVRLHKGATLVPDTIEPIVADTKPWSALVGVADLGAVLPRRTHRARQHGVRVDVDGVCLGECNAIRHVDHLIHGEQRSPMPTLQGQSSAVYPQAPARAAVGSSGVSAPDRNVLRIATASVQPDPLGQLAHPFGVNEHVTGGAGGAAAADRFDTDILLIEDLH